MIVFTKYFNDIKLITATVTLDFSTRSKSRTQIVLDDGRRAGLFLPHRGCLLRDGTLLSNDDCTEVLQINALSEQVSTVFFNDVQILARISYFLGNRHILLQITDCWIRYQHDYVLDNIVRSLGGVVSIDYVPFDPEYSVYQGLFHTHT